MKIVSDVVTMTRKEVWELRYSSRNLLWFLALLAGLSVIFISGDSARGLMSIGVFAQVTPALIAFGIAGQMSLDSILGEKKAGTLEVLLSTRLSSLAIVVAKTLIPVMIGYIFSQLIAVALALFSFIVFTSTTIWLAIILPLFVTYLASCITIAMTIVVRDEKMTPIFGGLLLLIPLLLLARYGSSTLSPMIIGLGTLLAILLCVGASWLAAFLLKHVPLVTTL